MNKAKKLTIYNQLAGLKKDFGFGESNKITSEVEENTNSQEAWQNQMLEMLELLGYSKVDTRPFYKRIYDKLTGKKVYN